MPDSFHLPFEGPQSHDDRALDSLLSGDFTDLPPSLRPVADTLNALRAAPSPRELRGEAAARAQFRAVRQESLPGPGESRTLVMPVVPSQRRRGAHVRAVRRRSFRTRALGLTAAAAVLLLAVAVTYTGNLPSGLQRIAHNTIAAPPSRTLWGGPATGGVQTASASPVVPTTAPPVQTPASQAPSAASGAHARKVLCKQFWSDLEHARPGRMSWQTPRYLQLITAAGGAQKVFSYCYPVWASQDGLQYGHLPSYPPYFPRKWGTQGDHGNDRGQNQGQPQAPQSPGDQQQPEPGQGTQPSNASEPQTGSSPSQNANQDQGNSSQN